MYLLFVPLLLSVYAQNDCWHQHVSIDRAVSHLKALDDIAKENGGNRAAGTSGYSDSVDYILSTLRTRTDFVVSVQSFDISNHQVIGTPVFTQVAPASVPFRYETDFRAFPASKSGSLNGVATFAVPLHGCTKADYSSFPAGRVALVSRGTCSFTEKAVLAAEAKAAAVLIYNNVGGIYNGAMDAVPIPALALSYEVGIALVEEKDVLVSVQLNTVANTITTFNVIADTKEGSANSVIVVGSHLDSVPAGPGINDNGSGSTTNLELALATVSCKQHLKSKVRFAWWGAEELGLLGSKFYVDNLKNTSGLSSISLNLNFDMLGSPNYQYGIYNGSSGPAPIRDVSAKIQKLFEDEFTKQSLPYVLSAFNGRSDYGPFIENGIPAGGLATGAEGIKDAAQRTIFGGFANTPYDPCYHAYCDSLENVSQVALKTNLDMAAKILGQLGTDPTLALSVRSERDFQTTYDYPKDPLAVVQM